MKPHHRTLLTLTVALALFVALPTALAGAVLAGRTYQGSMPSYGVSEGHTLRTNTNGKIVLRVSHNGRSVTVRFTSSAPLLYCHAQGTIHVQSGGTASISSKGTFRASVGERFAAGPGAAGITQVVSGRFSGHGVHGTISTQAGEYCSGSTSFSASAH